MAEREVYNPDTGQYELIYDDGFYEHPSYDETPDDSQSSSSSDPNAWLYDPNTTSFPFTPPGHEWFWTGKQWSTRPTQQNTGGGWLSEEEGRLHDDRHGLVGGYMGPNGWVHGSPRSSGPVGTSYQTSPTKSTWSPQFEFPMLDLPTLDEYPDFVPEKWEAPDPNDIHKDPSYQFRFDEGWRPIRNSRAAQGLARTGATLKAMQRYGQGFASNEYDRIYDRAADSYDRRNATQFGAWNANRQSRLDRYDRRINELRYEWEPRAKWAELQWHRDWDLYKYLNDDAYRRWKAEGDWTSTGTNQP